MSHEIPLDAEAPSDAELLKDACEAFRAGLYSVADRDANPLPKAIRAVGYTTFFQDKALNNDLFLKSVFFIISQSWDGFRNKDKGIALFREIIYLKSELRVALVPALRTFFVNINDLEPGERVCTWQEYYGGSLDLLCNLHSFTADLWNRRILLEDDLLVEGIANALETELPRRKWRYHLYIVEAWLRECHDDIRNRVEDRNTTYESYKYGILYAREVDVEADVGNVQATCPLDYRRWNWWRRRRYHLASAEGSGEFVEEAKKMQEIPIDETTGHYRY